MFPACVFFVGVALTPGDIYFDAHYLLQLWHLIYTL